MMRCGVVGSRADKLLVKRIGSEMMEYEEVKVFVLGYAIIVV